MFQAVPPVKRCKLIPSNSLIYWLLILIAPWFSPQFVVAEALKGQVVAIADGDTLTLLVGSAQHKVRLTEIDTPERAQPWGQKAKQALAVKVFQRTVMVQVSGHDRYGRTLGRVYLDNRDINRELVEEGHAWAYRQYLTDQDFLTAEALARDLKLGLWGSPNPVPPWDWRRGKRKAKPRDEDLATTSLQCGNKHFCKEMIHCAEARFQLLTCGVTSLDGDKDGIPCEALCN